VAGDAAVGIDDYLASGEAGIRNRPADYKTAGGVDVIAGVGVYHIGRNNLFDDLFYNILPYLLLFYVRAVLGADNYAVHPFRFAVMVFHRYL